ncbi:glycoside hydrolase [Haladaptatus sp. DYF46]|uniref:glycoside hydrolase n=1 Tax=Haladaptatus sp. DYF46 TaxID=2886041 RepID=UPI001E5E6EB4|nr:glycoside hydrolase [Haladaptatus sp. DYF46]
MGERNRTRRAVLRLGAVACGIGVTGDLGRQTTSNLDCLPGDGATNDEADAPVDVRGAIYFPSRAYNTFQMWHGYDSAVIERDLCYASRLNLNALRVWLSFEAWRREPTRFWLRLEHFLTTAANHGLRVLLGIFEGIGTNPTNHQLTNDDPLTARPVFSPSRGIMEHSNRWHLPRRFIRRFMERYRDDSRLLAIELINEPGWRPWKMRFSEAMFRTLSSHQGTVPLSVGSTNIPNNEEYREWGSEVFQCHKNFAHTKAQYRRMLRQITAAERRFGRPIWLSEWQRLSPPRRGQGTNPPNYSSLAPLIQRAGVGNFFWSLMVKPAYQVYRRKQGLISGIFHEDGAVWSLDDARAIKAMSGDPTFSAEERPEWPAWAEPVRESLND